MLTFKDFCQLDEKISGVSWLTKSYDHVFDGPVMIPMTSKLGEVFGTMRTTVFHMTSTPNLVRLASIQGSKKSISVATKMGPSAYSVDRPISGDRGKGYGSRPVADVIVKLDGNVLAGNTSDIQSQPDFQGRRWVPLRMLGDYANMTPAAMNVFDQLGQELTRWREDFAWEIAQKWAKYDPDKAEGPGDYEIIAFAKMAVIERKSKDLAQDILSWMGRLRERKTKRMNQDLATGIAGYIDKFHELLKKYGKKLETAIRAGFDAQHSSYNEFVANEIKIKELIWLNKEGHDLAFSPGGKGIGKKFKSYIGYDLDPDARRGSTVNMSKVDKFLKSK